MQSLNEWFGVLWELLLDCKEDLCFQLIRTTRPRSEKSMVELFEGSVTTEEAVIYARVLVDMGRELCAEEVLRLAAFGGVVDTEIAIYASESTQVAGGVVATA